MRAIDAGILICTECHELNKQEADTDEQVCTRCGAVVHARRPKPFEPVPVDRPGVGLERDLHRRFEAEPGSQQREDLLDFPRLEGRGRLAADVDRVEDQPARRLRVRADPCNDAVEPGAMHGADYRQGTLHFR